MVLACPYLSFWNIGQRVEKGKENKKQAGPGKEVRGLSEDVPAVYTVTGQWTGAESRLKDGAGDYVFPSQDLRMRSKKC